MRVHFDVDRFVKITTTRLCPAPPPGNVDSTANWVPRHAPLAAEEGVGSLLAEPRGVTPLGVVGVAGVVVVLAGVET